MSDLLSRNSRSQPFYFLATLTLIVAILVLARHILIPVALAILFSFMLGPAVRHFQRWGLARIPAVLVVSAITFIFLGVVFWAMMSQVVTLAKDTEVYEKIVKKKIAVLREGGTDSPISKFLGFGQRVTKEIAEVDESKNPKVPKELKEPSPPGEEKKGPQPVTVQSSFGEILSFFFATVTEVIRLIASLGLVIVLVVVTLIFKEELRDRFLRLTGSTRLTVTTKALDEAARRISDYLFHKTIVNSVYGAIVAVGLLFIGVPVGIVWGFLLAVLRFIPGLGFWLAFLPPAILSLIAFEGWETFFLVSGLFLTLEVLAKNVFEPRSYGKKIGLLPVATMISLTFWTWLWGPVGLLLAIPITVCLAVLGKYVPALSFLGVMLSDQPAMDRTLRYYQRLIAGDQDEATGIVENYLEKEKEATVHDNLLLPALSFARRDVANGQLTQMDQQFFYRATREILENVCEPLLTEKEEPAPTSKEDVVKILGCPVGDETDELALIMVNQELKPRGYFMKVGESGLLSGEIVEWIESEDPQAVCVLSVTPGELTQTRFVCKKLRGRFPKLKIVVARVGFPEDIAEEKEMLESAGADFVCESIQQTSQQLAQVWQQVINLQPANEPASATV